MRYGRVRRDWKHWNNDPWQGIANVSISHNQMEGIHTTPLHGPHQGRVSKQANILWNRLVYLYIGGFDWNQYSRLPVPVSQRNSSHTRSLCTSFLRYAPCFIETRREPLTVASHRWREAAAQRWSVTPVRSHGRLTRHGGRKCTGFFCFFSPRWMMDSSVAPMAARGAPINPSKSHLADRDSLPSPRPRWVQEGSSDS